MKSLIAFLALAVSGFAQPGYNHFVSTTGTTTLAAATTAVTLQQPSTGGKPIIPEWMEVYCSVACVVTQSQNCTTAATATAGTVVALPGNSGASATATFWTASNASGCTTVKKNNIPAGSTFSFSFNGLTLPVGTTTSNYTVSIASLTGDVVITIGHRENQ